MWRNCSNCRRCEVNIDFNTESVSRVCSVTGATVDKDNYCKSHDFKVAIETSKGDVYKAPLSYLEKGMKVW